ncbi:nodal homolog 3-A-like [Rhinophrynus dorsalis]
MVAEDQTGMVTEDIKECTSSEVAGLAEKLANGKAPWSDGITNLAIKNLLTASMEHLTKIFNACMRLQHFQRFWKEARVIVFPKAGKPLRDPVNYRPISLLSGLTKLLEKAHLAQLNNLVSERNLLAKEQFGFRKEHATTCNGQNHWKTLINDQTISPELEEMKRIMVFVTPILCITFISLVHGRPALLDRLETRIPLSQPNLGLKASTSLHEDRHLLGRKLPSYMMQLYHNLVRENDKPPSHLEHPALQESDTVLSFIAKGYTKVGNKWQFSFDISSISRSNDLTLAELRIHLHSSQRLHNVIVEIYHTKDGQQKLFLGSFKTNITLPLGSSWKVFNLTKMMQCHLHQENECDNSKYIEAKDKPGREQNTRQPDDEPIQSAEQGSPTDLNAESAILVVYTKDKPTSKPSPPSLIKKLASSSYSIAENANRVSVFRRLRRNRIEKLRINLLNTPPRPVEDGKHKCRRVDMFVDFEKVGWSNWIVHPKKYNAYRCEGACEVPLNETSKTNHAYIKSLIQLNDHERRECSSCVPIKMRPLSMMYYENEDLVLRHHEEMVVEHCGSI